MPAALILFASVISMKSFARPTMVEITRASKEDMGNDLHPEGAPDLKGEGGGAVKTKLG